ncbi:hypothetical protein V8B97DRAFT_1922047 [Scleroderma yunnanense]
MATPSSPIPVDELPVLYALLSVVQVTEQAHMAISALLLYEYFLSLDQEACIIVMSIFFPVPLSLFSDRVHMGIPLCLPAG